MNDEARFWSKVRIAGLDECWEWQAARNSSGYGQIRWRRPDGSAYAERAHRVSWSLAHGSMPSLFVLHRCDNRLCVNPAHLFLGDSHDNVHDAMKKGRIASKLIDGDVEAMFLMWEPGITGPGSIARMFEVNESTVRDILAGRAWKHVQEKLHARGQVVTGSTVRI